MSSFEDDVLLLVKCQCSDHSKEQLVLPNFVAKLLNDHHASLFILFVVSSMYSDDDLLHVLADDHGLYSMSFPLATQTLSA